MNRRVLYGALLTVGALGMLALTAGQASATLTPVNAAVSWSSTNSQLTQQAAPRPTITCAATDLTGTINAIGSAMSLRMTPTRCRLSGVAVNVVCRGEMTIAFNGSVSGVQAFGDVRLDTGFSCSYDAPTLGCTTNLNGPQGPFARSATYVQAGQSMTITMAVNTVGRRPCPTGAVTFSASFSVVGGRLTVS